MLVSYTFMQYDVQPFEKKNTQNNVRGHSAHMRIGQRDVVVAIDITRRPLCSLHHVVT